MSAICQSLDPVTIPHEWRFVGDVMTPRGLVTVYRCLQCGRTTNAPAGSCGDTLTSWRRGAGSCPGLDQVDAQQTRVTMVGA